METLQSLERLRKNLKRLRRERGLTQRDLATIVGVHCAHISKLEGNPKKYLLGPTLRDLERLSRALNVDVQELLARSDYANTTD